MKVINVQFYPWDRDLYYQSGGLDLKKGDKIVADSELGRDLGTVAGVSEADAKEAEELTAVERRATKEDLAKAEEYKKRAAKALLACRKLVDKHKLPMKMVDAYFALDGERITFSFVAEERIDFRALVRDLTGFFQKSVRLQQIGSRDECRAIGGFGPCGRPLCCHSFLKKIESITTDVAREQQMVQRGSDRISGLCGRLICCLNYEKDFYEKMSKKLPALDSQVETSYGTGKVVGRNMIRQTLMVLMPDSHTPVEVKLAEVKKVKAPD